MDKAGVALGALTRLVLVHEGIAWVVRGSSPVPLPDSLELVAI